METEEEEDDDTHDYSMFIAQLMHSRVFSACDDSHSANEICYVDPDESNNGDSNLEVPDTMKESDLAHGILLSSGKMKQAAGLHCNERIVNALRHREIGCCGVKRNKSFTPGCRTAVCSKQLPTKLVRSVPLREKIFCGIYSEDGNTFLSACQDGYLRVYDTTCFRDMSKPCLPFKTIAARDVGWSILDVAFSPDALYAAYSTWSSDIHMASIYDNGDSTLSSHVAMDLQPGHPSFAAFSLQFSSDNNEILCGANDGHLYIYDRNLRRRTSRIYAHEDDVNAICFADKSSQIVFSGGDDGLVNVWDRRALREDRPQKVGSFAGHVDGITFIDSKKDARYLLSNSKDQAIKVWDMRKFSSAEAQHVVKQVVSHQTWDYRWQQVPRRQRRRKKTVIGDTSVKTYQGHTITNTLIRARFSPLHSTGQRYIYCGCAKGNVIIYDVLTGDIISQARKHKHCVRDVSWHPYEPVLVSSSWDTHFHIWQYDSCGESAKPSVWISSRKRQHMLRELLESDDEEENDDHAPSRRSPRLARSSRGNTS